MRGCVSRILRGTSRLRGASSLTFHQEREPAAFLGNVFDHFGFTLPHNACVKASAFAINVFVNLDAIFDAHTKRYIRIFSNTVQLFANMGAMEIQFQNAALQAVPERQWNHVRHAHIRIVHHRDMTGGALLDNLCDILVAQNFSVFTPHHKPLEHPVVHTELKRNILGATQVDKITLGIGVKFTQAKTYAKI